MDTLGKLEVDLEAFPNAKLLISKCQEFLSEVVNQSVNPILHGPCEHILRSDRTPGKALEEFLNANHGPGTPHYEELCALTLQGLSEGWVANIEIDGKKYRRSKICLPSAETNYFSITTVYMESEAEFRGQYHAHPYGEINCVVQIDKSAELMGMNGWRGKGWTSPGPGSHHFPEVRGGALIALFFLPAGRISYDIEPGLPQPDGTY